MDAHRNAHPVVGDGDRVVGVNGQGDVLAPPDHRLVDGIVHDLPGQVVQPARGRVADVHARSLADGLHAAQDLDHALVVRAAGGGLGFLDRLFGRFLGHYASLLPSLNRR